MQNNFQINFSPHKVEKLNKIINYGKYTLADDKATINKSIDEFSFYYLYLSLLNISVSDEQKLTPVLHTGLAVIMNKPLTFTIPLDSKSGVLEGLTNELLSEDTEDRRAKNPPNIYQIINKLKAKGYLVINKEDNIVSLNNELRTVQYRVKKQIETNGYATFDYIFKSVIRPS